MKYTIRLAHLNTKILINWMLSRRHYLVCTFSVNGGDKIAVITILFNEFFSYDRLWELTCIKSLKSAQKKINIVIIVELGNTYIEGLISYL